MTERNDGSIERANKGIQEAQKILQTVEAYNQSEKDMPDLPIKSNTPWVDWNQAADFIVRLWGISDESPDTQFAMKVYKVKYPDNSEHTFKEALWGLIATQTLDLSPNRILTLRPDIKKQFI